MDGSRHAVSSLLDRSSHGMDRSSHRMDRSSHRMDKSSHGMDRSSHGMDRSFHGVGFQLEPSAQEQMSEGPEGRTTATPTNGVAASEGGDGDSSTTPASWLRLATDDPENQFHEIFTFDDDADGSAGGSADGSRPFKQDSSRLLILTSIEGGQHKQPPLFKR